MIPDSDLEMGQTRLLEVDNPIVLPENTHVRFIVTSTDVLHDFALPSAGIKIDATPGRLNQSSFFSEREAELFGQCSELCGTFHGFMPIQLEVVPFEGYLSFIDSLYLLPLCLETISKKKIFLNNNYSSVYPMDGTKNNSNLISVKALHSTAILFNPNDNIVERTIQTQDNMNQALDRLQLVKYQESKNLEEDLKITSVSDSSSYEESFPWFVKDGKNIDYDQNLTLEKGVELATHFLKKRYKEGEVCDIKLIDLLKPLAGEEEKGTTILEYFNHLSNLSKKDSSTFTESSLQAESNNTSSTSVGLPLRDRPFGDIGDLTINEIYTKFSSLNFPLGNLTVVLDAFKFVPAILIYRGVVNAYINSA